MKRPLVHKKFLLEKFPGKSGWTFAAIPQVTPDSRAPFGWVCVKGRIDDHEFDHYKLMPMGNGKLFFPVKAALRKKLGKQAGDYVTIVLFPDDSLFEIPPDFRLCLEDSPDALRNFQLCTEGEKKALIDRIYAAKKESTRIAKMAEAIKNLEKGNQLRRQSSGKQ